MVYETNFIEIAPSYDKNPLNKKNINIQTLKKVLSIFLVLIAIESTPTRTYASQQSYAQESTTTQWRKTKKGWVDLSKWNRPEPIRVERKIELIHPLVFAAAIILVSSGLLIWASEEIEWARIFRNG